VNLYTVYLLYRLCNESFDDETDSGDKQETRGTAFVVYEDIYYVKCSGSFIRIQCLRAILDSVIYYQQARMQKVVDNVSKEKKSTK
jgi:hypothetical protein